MPPQKPRPKNNTRQGRSGSLVDHLAAAESFSRLSEHANRLRRLQSLLDTVLHPSLLPGTRIANLKQDKAVIHVDSGAVAVKLRQMAPRLAEEFRQQGQQVTGIVVKVQGQRGLSPGGRKKSTLMLGLKAKRALTSLVAGLTEQSAVRRSLEKLLRNL